MMFNSVCNHTSDYYCGHNCHVKRNNLAAKEINSQQKKKEKPRGKIKNLTAKRKDSRQKKKPHGKSRGLVQECIRFCCGIEMINEYGFY